MKRHFKLDKYNRIRFDYIDCLKSYVERAEGELEYNAITAMMRGGHQYLIPSEHADQFIKEYDSYLSGLSYLPSVD